MRWLGRQIRRLALVLAAFCVLLVGLHLATMAPKDRSMDLMTAPSQGIEIWVVDHGFHSGLVISPTSLRRAAVEIGREDPAAARRLRWLSNLFADATWLEIGWGDAAFYRQTHGVGDVDLLLGLRALLWPTDAVLQVVPGWGPVEGWFSGSGAIRLGVKAKGLAGITSRLAKTIPEPTPANGLGPSLYGAGAFYPAALDYHLFRTCNHWVAWLLRGAGVPASPVPGTFSTTLMAELHWRLP
jgi:hypothetical protein